MTKDKPARLGLFHHAGDYVVAALALLSLGRADSVIWPFAVGLVAFCNAAMTRGPLAAYRKISVGAHRVIDVGVVAVCVVGAVAVRDHRSEALVLVAIGVVQSTIIWLSRIAKQAKAG